MERIIFLNGDLKPESEALISVNDRSVLFGDGAGAVVLEAAEEPGILSTHMHANGDHVELLRTRAGEVCPLPSAPSRAYQ